MPLLPPAVFLLVWLGWRPVREASEVVRCLLATRRMRLGSTWRQDSHNGVLLGDLGTPNAFTAGLLRPAVLADRRWWATLTTAERRIVLAHEQSHVGCRDLLTHTTGRLLQGLVPRRLGGPLLQGWLASAEQRADAVAACDVGDPLAVAALLLRQTRENVSPSLVPGFTGHGLQGRIRALLADPVGPARLHSDLGLGLPLAAASLIMAGLLGYQIHAALEQLLHLHP